MLILEVIATLMVAIAMGLSLAHALELPGKLRLTRDQYLAVQGIYYPGFTIGGAAEPLAGVLLLILVGLTPPQHTLQFGLIATALLAIVVVQLVFWTMTQPVNRYWLATTPKNPTADRFFGQLRSAEERVDWTVLRDRWERSHVLRAIASAVALTCLVIAISTGGP